MWIKVRAVQCHPHRQKYVRFCLFSSQIRVRNTTSTEEQALNTPPSELAPESPFHTEQRRKWSTDSQHAHQTQTVKRYQVQTGAALEPGGGLVTTAAA